jgi:ribosomal protein S18 acetylase RimI-like enzyme
MKENYNIRNLNENDILSVVNIVRGSFDEEYLLPSIYRGKGIEKFINNELKNKFSPYKYFVLCNDELVIGYAEFKVFKSESMAFLNIISVRDEYKNKGVGRKLLEYCQDFFFKNGFNAIQLDVYKTNIIALNWYNDFGFNLIKTNSLYRINFNNKTPVFNNIYIQNFPQFQELQQTLGFYFLDVIIGNKNIVIGFIENDLFLRGNYDQSIYAQLEYLSNSLKIKNVYFIGNICQSLECSFINEIIRMELKL